MIEYIKRAIRRIMRSVAHVLNKVSGGKVTPNGVTLFGVAMHIPIAWLIATHYNIWAAALLLVFGLFDTLDGELARMQNRASLKGRLLDSVTDRVKEVMLYVGVAYAIIANSNHPYLAVWAVAACGCSLLTSYVNAAGDSIMAGKKSVEHASNKAFRGGLLPFEIRMFILIVGLLANQVAPAVIIIALGAAYTALSRLYRVLGRLTEANA
jgi:archaetidylinositol phosphate synthase